MFWLLLYPLSVFVLVPQWVQSCVICADSDTSLFTNKRSLYIFDFFYFFQSFTMRALTGCWRPVSLLLLAALLIENSLANVIRYDGDVNIGENIKYFIFNTSKYTNFNIHIQVLHSNICIIQSHHISHFNLPIALYPKSSRDSRIILWIIRHSFLSANFVIANYNIEIKIKSVIPLSGCLTPCLGILTWCFAGLIPVRHAISIISVLIITHNNGMLLIILL